MNVFREEPRFNPRTGQPMDPVKVVDHMRCDYCGARLEEDDLSSTPAFRIVESGDTEESWYYYGSDVRGITGHAIDHHKIFTEHEDYRYCTDYNATRTSCSFEMVRAAVEKTVEVDEFLDSIMEEARIAVVQKLLDEGLTPKQLGIEE